MASEQEFRAEHKLSEFARAGFQELSRSRENLLELADAVRVPSAVLLQSFAFAADPDAALERSWELANLHPDTVAALDRGQGERLALLFGASPALGTFFTRRPERLPEILSRGGRLFNQDEATDLLTSALNQDCDESMSGEYPRNELRVRYRELLAEVVLYDLRQGSEGSAIEAFDGVARSLSALAGAAIEAALTVSKRALVAGLAGPAVPQAHLDEVRLAVIAMGKCGAQELNVVSDVDVMFIVESSDQETVGPDRLIRLGTKLASEMMRTLHDPGLEPPLWQVDANLRPEGRNGPLVRTLGSMLAYYDRWAKAWEFQALIKARPLAGDQELGESFVSQVAPLVWASSGREDFVGSVQRMRERVTEFISEDELEVQLKLGPGGLRDIEFSAQLLQLVHGTHDERLHLRGTLPALSALVDGGYIARADGERLAAHYRFLRVLEHRLQLADLRRTAIMPANDEEGLRILARASSFAQSGPELLELWEATKREVRSLHIKIFYAPLLSAVAALPEEEFVLGGDAAKARLASIGFRDPNGAMRHLTALTHGTSRRARIQRNLMPVLLRWLAEGTDPDYGLLAFRRVSEANTDSHWYLRLLRDGSDAAERLMTVLANSRFTSELLVTIPDAVAWLEKRSLLQPVSLRTLAEEMRSLASRRDNLEAAAAALRAVHRREILRLAMGRVTGVVSDDEVAQGLDAAHTALLDSLLFSLRRDESETSTQGRLELTLIGMGRYGGREMGFGSDIDLIAVYRAPEDLASDVASRQAIKLITELRRLVSDPRFSVDLDFDLRPEGKNGALARSLSGYRSYYERWSLTWEAQALLRARPVAGDEQLGSDFVALANEIRYPPQFEDTSVREIRRLKARMEAERLPRGADPARHLKLGPGGLSDVEWLVQLLQLQYASAHEDMRTVSTLGALRAAAAHGYLSETAREHLEEAWRTASEIRSALRLWSGKAADVLPFDRGELAGIAGILGIQHGNTSELEEQWFAASRRARAVFEREFFAFVEADDRFPLH